MSYEKNAIQPAETDEDSVNFCRYKMGKRYVDMSASDYKDICRKHWLNDKHIDVLLHWVMQNTLKSSKVKDVHVFGAHFYVALKYWYNSPTEESTLRINLATRQINLFEKKHIILPICENEHWMLGVISWPRIIVLDSLKPRKVDHIFQYVEKFVMYEARKYGIENCFSHAPLQKGYPECTQQNNLVDCGIFILKFAENLAKKINNGQKMVKINVEDSRIDRVNIAKAMNRWINKFKIESKENIPTSHRKILHLTVSELKEKWEVNRYLRKIVRVEGKDYVIIIGRGGKETVKKY